MKQSFTKTEMLRIAQINAITGLVLGTILIFLLFPVSDAFTGNDATGNLRLVNAKTFSDNFKHTKLMRGFYPKTQCVVHSYDSLKKYIDALPAKFFETSDTDGDTSYKRGVALYFGKSNRKNYVQQINNGRTECLMRKNYTVFLLPVYYKEKDTTIECNGVRNKTLVQNARVSVKTLDSLFSPLDSIVVNRRFARFVKRVEMVFEDENDELAFDLGHTYP